MRCFKPSTGETVVVAPDVGVDADESCELLLQAVAVSTSAQTTDPQRNVVRR